MARIIGIALPGDVQPPWTVTVVMYVHVHRSKKALSIARYQILTRSFLSEQLYRRVGAIMEHNDRDILEFLRE